MTEPSFAEDDGDYAGRTFRGVKAAGTVVQNVVFTDCVFDRCGFSRTEFLRCSFTGCAFRTSDLSLARFTSSRFVDTAFSESKLIGIDWPSVTNVRALPLTIGFEACVVSHSSFAGLNLRRLKLERCVAERVDFGGADLTEATFGETDFSGATFDDTTLTGADFRGARGYVIDPRRNRVARAKFSMPDAVGLLHALDVVID
jgi:uncharacterized protein YjbI with pentapeptide repeats